MIIYCDCCDKNYSESNCIFYAKGYIFIVTISVVFLQYECSMSASVGPSGVEIASSLSPGFHHEEFERIIFGAC